MKPESTRDGYSQEVFGPMFWTIMHMVAHNFPVLEDDRSNATVAKKYMRFFKSIGDVLPCRSCREHFKKRISGKTCTRLDDKVFQNRTTLARWVWRLHNCVNRDLGKPVVSFEDSSHMYNEVRRRRSVTIRVGKIRMKKSHASLVI